MANWRRRLAVNGSGAEIWGSRVMQEASVQGRDTLKDCKTGLAAGRLANKGVVVTKSLEKKVDHETGGKFLEGFLIE